MAIVPFSFDCSKDAGVVMRPNEHVDDAEAVGVLGGAHGSHPEAVGQPGRHGR